MKISPQSSEEIQLELKYRTVFVNNKIYADKLSSEIFVYGKK